MGSFMSLRRTSLHGVPLRRTPPRAEFRRTSQCSCGIVLAVLLWSVVLSCFRAQANDDAKALALTVIKESGIRLVRDESGQHVSARIPADFARSVEQPELAIRALAALDTVREVDASGRRVTKAMLESLLSLESVRVLRLAGAKFDDQDVARPKAKALEKLDLSGSNANDALLLAIGAIPSIRELNLSKTKVSADGLVALSRLKNLESLNLSRTSTMLEGAQHLGHLTSLVRLDLSFMHSGAIGPGDARFLTTLKRLEYLNLGGTLVHDESLVELDKLTALRELSLEDSRGSYRGLAHLKSLKNLTTLRWNAGTRDKTHNELFELKKRLPNVRIADLVLRAAGVSRNRDQNGEITSLTIEFPDEIPTVNRLIEAGELSKLTAMEIGGFSELARAGLDGLTLPKSLTRIVAHQVTPISPKLITRIAALPNLKSFSVWRDSLTDESRAELKKVANRVEINLTGRSGTTRLRAE